MGVEAPGVRDGPIPNVTRRRPFGRRLEQPQPRCARRWTSRGRRICAQVISGPPGGVLRAMKSPQTILVSPTAGERVAHRVEGAPGDLLSRADAGGRMRRRATSTGPVAEGGLAARGCQLDRCSWARHCRVGAKHDAALAGLARGEQVCVAAVGASRQAVEMTSWRRPRAGERALATCGSAVTRDFLQRDIAPVGSSPAIACA